ncbi:ATP-binding protein [Streptomyces sp. NPDC127098]|uniref:ATP-binding protein n=1 Tax=Streptomyces sp. NPDC127098 TaxID=3347137 RepID=UPI00364ABDA1
MRKPVVRADPLPPVRRARAAAPARGRLLPPALVALCGLAAVLLAPGDARLPVLWCGAAATLAVAVTWGETVRRGHAAERLRVKVGQQLADAELVAYDLLPAALDELKRGNLEADVLPGIPDSASDPRLARAHRAMVHAIVDVLREKELQRDSAKRAIVNIACRIQSEIHRLQDDVGKMEFRHNDPDVMSDLMRLEHGINVTGRFATSLAVLGGGAPMRRWEHPITLYDVMRAGAGPIREYLRVKQHHVIDCGIHGHAVEPLIMVLGELLDNATRYSPPNAEVIMNTEEVALGIEISIEDKGTGLTGESRRRAEFLLQQGVDGLDLEDLGETARVGLRVAGILASHHGARISLRPSTCGGVRAVLFIPNELITHTPPPPYELPPLRPAPRWPVRPVVEPSLYGDDEDDDPYGHLPGLDDEEPQYERAANGLPQRRRPIPRGRSSAAATRRPATPPAAGAAGEEPPAAPGLWVDSFFEGLRRSDEQHAAAATERPTGQDPGPPPGSGR